MGHRELIDWSPNQHVDHMPHMRDTLHGKQIVHISFLTWRLMIVFGPPEDWQRRSRVIQVPRIQFSTYSDKENRTFELQEIHNWSEEDRIAVGQDESLSINFHNINKLYSSKMAHPPDSNMTYCLHSRVQLQVASFSWTLQGLFSFDSSSAATSKPT